MLDDLELGRRIRQARLDAGLTQLSVAEILGVSDKAVSGWERTGKISKTKLQELAQATRKPLSYFMPGAPVSAEIRADGVGRTSAACASRPRWAMDRSPTHMQIPTS